MTESRQAIDRLKRKVMWRARMIALQDYAAILLTAGGILAAAIALYIKLKPIQTAWWPFSSAAFALIAVALLARWFKTSATESEAAFKIDRALELEDRFTTAQAVIERGGPGSPIEDALVEDAARHISKADESKIVPYAVARWHALSLLGVAALVTALAVPQRALPGGEQLIAERANIEVAGDRLEQTAEEVKQSAPAGTETADLAREQADLGRAFRRTTITTAEALKKLSALEERIRERHDELASTRADEIVSLAEKRFEPALAPKPKEAQKQSAADQKTEEGQTESGDESKPAKKDDSRPADLRAENRNVAQGKQAASESKQPETAAANSNRQTAADRKPPSDGGARKPDEKTGEQNRSQPESANRADKQNVRPQQAPPENRSPEQPKAGEPQKAEAEKNPAAEATGSLVEQGMKALPESAVEQAAKAATPMLSDQLMKQAEQLRANQLTPEDIRKLRQAAESLARDLAPLAQSKEFQQTVEQLARQVNPEQLERLARELMSREDIRREIESAARLLMENRQVKEMVAGLTEMARSQDQANQQNDRGANQSQAQGGSEGGSNPRGDGQSGQPGQSGQAGQEGQAGQTGQAGRGGRGNQQRAPAEIKLSGQGKEVKQGGTIQRKPGGEYLYLESKPGAGAARVPYSSAYPQYRREAERSVERSQVPQHMRSVVRKYFDAINPDSKKKE